MRLYSVPFSLPLSTHSQIGATFSKTILFHKWIPLSITYRPLKGLGPIVQHGLKNRQWNFFPSQILYLTVKKFQPKGRFCIWVRFRKWRMKNFKPRADFAPPTKIAFYTCQKPSHLRPSPAILKSATFSIITNTVRKQTKSNVNWSSIFQANLTLYSVVRSA